ncbi:Phospholipase A1-II 3 [Capsicum annuum]|uniref:Phospholipase A1 n=1 Tax=Capsicum annuum TaxID=4072 RepID=A0A1U8FM40_CAPAN|nr:phospholipase A1-IIgamma [Capsicum annuum]KAF3652406.1 Phospholipase A1-II 3 [Capsicum annuum]KAF3680492.1 Phospholipase A1-II 3 [Capsicum annuum]PHT89976.1 Phospholipase A1-II 3 [Capsicum annuum]
MTSMDEKWEELSGKNNWDGLLDPLDVDLRKYIIQYGELAHVTYDTFIDDKASKYAGASRYAMENLFARAGLDPSKYRVTKYFYATSSMPLPDAFILKSWSREAWSKESNFMGYIAVATDEGKVTLGRRDIVVAWRGTIQTLEWVNDLQFLLIPGPKIFGDGGLVPLFQPLVHHGFYGIYTSEDPRSKFNQASARDQVLEEVKRLVEEYRDEEVSITVAGHSLGASLATMNAVDIAFNGINKTSTGKEFPVTAFVFASPKVGDLNFQKASSKLKNLHVLRVHNLLDIVPKYPPVGYFDIGQEIVIDTTKSPYLKVNPGDPHTRHNLEGYLHGIDGTQGIGPLAGFKLEVNRDLALVNRIWDILKDEYLVPGAWWVEKNKGMVQQENGKWVLMDREEYDL